MQSDADIKSHNLIFTHSKGSVQPEILTDLALWAFYTYVVSLTGPSQRTSST